MKMHLLAGALLLAACASENFDAPLDQNGDAPAKLCAGATGTDASGCVFYDGFGADLIRWNVHNPAPDDATVHQLAVASDGRAGILQVGHCPEITKPSLETELRLRQAGAFTIRTEWRSADFDGAVLRMYLDDVALEFPTDVSDSPPAWIATTISASATTNRPILRLEAESLSTTLCANAWIDWIAVQQ